jgi:hypothetical protein|eukprot:COSAG02_NODE_7784_length_2846_cov_4.121587_2_plen_156_part_00
MDADVAAMGGDDEDEYEDVFVMLELPDLHSSFLSSCDTYSLIGLDTPTPILKLGGAVFRGSHEDTLGTHLVFSDTQDLAGLPGSARIPAPKSSLPGAAAAAPRARSEQHLIAQSTQKICFERVLLEPRHAAQQGQQAQDDDAHRESTPVGARADE